MSKNEEQFYGMFREAFDNFSPEVPAHIYDNVRAGMVRTGFAWKKWSAALLLLIGAGTLTWTAWPVDSTSGKSIAKQDGTEMQIRSAFVSSNATEPAIVCSVANHAPVHTNRSLQSATSVSETNPPILPIQQSNHQENQLLMGMDQVAPVIDENVLVPVQTETASSTDIEPVIIDSGASKVIWPIKVKRTVTIDE